MPTGQIRALYLDRRGRLWIGNRQGGLARIDDPAAESPRFVTYTTAEGLASNDVLCIAECVGVGSEWDTAANAWVVGAVAGIKTREHERSERSLTKNMCKEMLEIEPAMWLFIQKPEVGLTNNEAERALRHAVLWRRVSFGSQSESGAEMVGRMLTVVMTLKRRGESIHKYLVEACRARHEGRASPSLLPAAMLQPALAIT